jgi:hypothetical protein
MGSNWHSLRATILGWGIGLTTLSSHRFCLAGTLKYILRNGLISGGFRRVARVFGHYAHTIPSRNVKAMTTQGVALKGSVNEIVLFC